MRQKPRLTESRGSVLLLTVVLLCLLSVLFLLATNSVLLGTRARRSLEESLEMFYIAEAGLSHGQAFCAAHGDAWFSPVGENEDKDATGHPEIDSPFDRWVSFGRGRYRIEAYRLGLDDQPFVDRHDGILILSTAELEGVGRKRAFLLLEDPPSCEPLAWWEPP